MPEARQPVDEQLDRPAAGGEAPPADAAKADPHSSPGATAPGDDGRAAAQGEDSGGPDSSARESSGPESSGPDADESALQGDVDELVAVAAQRDDYLALAQRTQADFENYRKRVARESVAAQERGLTKLAQELLPALDNLDRALAEARGGEAEERDETEGRDEALLEGVRLVRSELHAALARVGIERFSPEGEKFDPSQHEAMAQQAVEGAKSGTVVEVFQPGYRRGDTIIRPARVLVAA
jgi:molecular chaperone GrpE